MLKNESSLSKYKPLTNTDVLIEYLIVKTKNGLASSVTLDNYVHFLKHSKLTFDPNVKDIIECAENCDCIDVVIEDGKLIFKANYKLTEKSKRVDIAELQNLIFGRYIKSIETVESAEIVPFETDDEKVSALSSFITSKIYERDIKENIKAGIWPKYAYDMEKFLFETDLSLMLGMSSLKGKYINLYKKINSCLGYMYHIDSKLKISNISESYLAWFNYIRLLYAVPEFKEAFNDLGVTIDLEGGTILFKDLKTGQLKANRIITMKNLILRKNFIENK